jgi:MFS family permease
VRDHLSAFTITIVYAIRAGGTIATLLASPFLAARLGRRRVMLAAVVTMVVAAGLLAAWKDLPGLLIGRLLTGVTAGWPRARRSSTSSSCRSAPTRPHPWSGPGRSAPR